MICVSTYYHFVQVRLYAAGNQVTAISAAPDAAAAARLLPSP